MISVTGSPAGSFAIGVTYWPADTGPLLWHRFDEERVRRDLAAIRTLGFDTVRVLLGWDAFMPTDREVSPTRLAELESLLRASSELGLGVVPVLFAQSLADCVILPPYAVDPRAPRRGVRVVASGVVREGGPRDLYADPLMLELQLRWLEALIDGFAGHPAVVAWDLGHDPASTVRPRRFDDLRRWAVTVSEPLRSAGERSWLTVGAADLLTARGVRLRLVSDCVDALGLLVLPQAVGLGRPPLSREPALFLSELARRLAARDDLPLMVTTGIAAGERGGELAGAARPPDLEPAESVAAAVHSRAVLDGLRRVGAGGALAWTWACTRRELLVVPPFDRFPSLARFGLTERDGELAATGEAWARAAAQGLARQPASPWTNDLDEEDYYANLPASALDLFASWRRARGDQPGILD